MFWVPLALAAASAASSYMGAKGQKKTSTSTQSEQQRQQSTQRMTLPPEVANAYWTYNNLLTDSLGRPLQYYPGQGYVSPSEATQQAWALRQQQIPWFQQASESAAGGAPYYQQGARMALQGTGNMLGGAGLVAGAVPGMQNTLGTSGGNYNFLSNAADVANNPYVQSQLGVNAQQVGQQLKEQWLPPIQSGAIASNALGSARQGLAQGQAIERAAQQLSQANANTLLNAYGQGLGAQQYALGQTGNMLQNMTAPGEAMYRSGQLMGGAGSQAGMAGGLMGQAGGAYGQAGQYMGNAADAAYGVGQAQEAYQQRALEDAMARWQFGQMEPWQRMQMGRQGLEYFNPFGITQTDQVGTATQTTTGPNPNYRNPWSSALAGAIGGGMLGYGIGRDLGWWGGSTPQSQPVSTGDPRMDAQKGLGNYAPAPAFTWYNPSTWW